MMGTPHDEADFSNSLVRMFACSQKPLANLFGSGHPEDEADAAQLWAQTLSQAYRF